MAKKILIVEDNDLNLKLFKDLLEAHGYETLELRDGLDAVAVVKRHRPDLILMDIQLPEISGLDVTKKIKAEKEIADIPIIAVTSYPERYPRDEAFRAGCDG